MNQKEQREQNEKRLQALSQRLGTSYSLKLDTYDPTTAILRYNGLILDRVSLGKNDEAMMEQINAWGSKEHLFQKPEELR